MIRISIAEAGKSPQLLTFNASAITLGRAAQHELCLTGKGVSSTHCRILREGDTYFVEDVGSTNGTYINRQRVSGRQAIGPQDEVVLAVYRLRVLVDSESAVARMPSAVMPMATPMGEGPPMMATPGVRRAAPTDYMPPPSGAAVLPSGPSMPPSGPSMPPSGPSMPPSGPSMPPSGLSMMPPSGPSMPPSGPPSSLAAGSGAVSVMGSSGHSALSGPSSADRAWGREWELIDKLATAWLSSGKDSGQLLRGEKLAHARKWLAQGRRKHPPPKPLHRDFILAGARARTLRVLGGTMVGALMLGGVGLGAWYLVQSSSTDEGGDGGNVAKLDVGSGGGPVESTAHGDAEAAAALATAASEEGDPVVAVLLAAEAVVRLPPEDAELDAFAFDVLRTNLRDLPGRPLRGPGGEGHRGPVERVALSPDGRWAITAGSRGDDVYLWDLDVPGVLDPSSLAGHPRGLTGMEVSEDGRWLVTADADGLAMRWNLKDRDPAGTNARLEDHRAPISALDLSRNGRWLVTGDESGKVKVWDLDTPLPSASTLPRGHEGKVTGVAINDDGTRVVSSGEDMTARNWRVSDGRGKNPVVALHEEVVVTAVGLAPDDGWAVSGGDDGVVRLWPPTTTVPTRRWELLPGHKGAVSTIEVTADSSMAVSVAQDDGLWIWDLKAKVPAASSVRLPGHTGRIHQLALYSPPPPLVSGRHVPTSAFTASDDGTARTWDLDQRKSGAASRVFSGHEGAIRSIAVSGDGQWAITGGADKVARVWDWQSLPMYSAETAGSVVRLGSASKVGRGHTMPVVAVAVDAFGRRMITGSADGTARIWDMRHETRLSSLPLIDVHTDRVRAVAVSSADKWAASGDNSGRLVLWNIVAETPVSRTLVGHSGEIGALEFTPDGQRLISVSTDRTARVWTMGTDPESAVTVLQHDDEVTQLAVSGDGRWLLTGTLTAAVLWDLEGSLEAPAKTFKGHEDDLKAVALGPRGRWAATAADRKILLRDINKDKVVAKLRKHEGAIQVLAFHPNAKWLASGSEDKSIRLWDLTSAHPDEGSLELTGHSGGITDLEWSPDGRWLVSASNDGTIRLWDTRKDLIEMVEGVIMLEGHTGVVPRISLVTKDGGRLSQVVSVSYDGTARLWPLEPNELVSLACSAAGRRLTEEERTAFEVSGKYGPACGS